MTRQSNNSLIKTNPYLRNLQERETQFFTAVLTSTGVEGVSLAPADLKKPSRKTSKRK